jgi:hypothetical protein
MRNDTLFSFVYCSMGIIPLGLLAWFRAARACSNDGMDTSCVMFRYLEEEEWHIVKVPNITDWQSYFGHVLEHVLYSTRRRQEASSIHVSYRYARVHNILMFV